MNRRIAMKYVSTMLGLAISAPTLSALDKFSQKKLFNQGQKTHFLSAEEFNMLEEITELILPKTNTPGAKEAKVAEFIDLVLADCYIEKEKNIFREGLQNLLNTHFLTLTMSQQISFLKDIEIASFRNRNLSNETDFWKILKELTLLGYFGSEVGIKACFDYRPVPGKLENVKWEKGMKMISY